MKTWIKTNLSKIALALTGAVNGVTCLIIGSIAQNKTNGYQSFLGHDYTVYWGGLAQKYGHTKQKMNIK